MDSRSAKARTKHVKPRCRSAPRARHAYRHFGNSNRGSAAVRTAGAGRRAVRVDAVGDECGAFAARLNGAISQKILMGFMGIRLERAEPIRSRLDFIQETGLVVVADADVPQRKS